MNTNTGADKKQILSTTFTVLCCIAIFAVLATGIVVISRTYTKKAGDMVYKIVDENLKQDVQQIVVDIEVFRANEITRAEEHIKAFGTELEQTASKSYDLISGPFGDAWRFEGLVFMAWDHTGALVYTDIPAEARSVKAFEENEAALLLAAYKIYHKGADTVLCGVPMELIDDLTKEYAYQMIHAAHFDDNTYIWVNEVLNYEGGEGYAIRRIHPNLKDTEGMLLSTQMQDMAGGHPYLEELEGVNRDGEIWYSYYFKLLNGEEIALKKTYAYLYRPYNWIICEGTYIQDIDTYTTDIWNDSIKVSLTSILMVAVFLIAIITAILRQAKRNARIYASLEAEHRLNSTKEQIFSSLSHDMRTPLNAIIGFSNLAEKEDCSPKVRDYLEKIHISGDVMMGLLSDTLFISRMNDKAHSLDAKPFHLSELARECLVVSKELADEKGVTLVSRVPKEDHVLLGDRSAIEKIFMNLTSNAVKYTPAGGTVRVELALLEPSARDAAPVYHGDPDYASSVAGHPDISFTVQDTGIGMSRDFVDHMFEPFTQENPASALKHGVGLGLAIVKQLLDLMDGKVNVKSVKGKGSTFQVTIPLWRLKDSTLEPLTGVEPADVPEDAFSRGVKVLLCEDNELNRELATDILTTAGIDVVCAEDGRAGCEIFAASRAEEYTVILMDLRMPVMNGYEAARAIRAMERADARSIPIIALSADAFEEDKIKAMEAGMDAHISKPIHVDELMHILKIQVEQGHKEAR